MFQNIEQSYIMCIIHTFFPVIWIFSMISFSKERTRAGSTKNSCRFYYPFPPYVSSFAHIYIILPNKFAEN